MVGHVPAGGHGARGEPIVRREDHVLPFEPVALGPRPYILEETRRRRLAPHVRQNLSDEDVVGQPGEAGHGLCASCLTALCHSMLLRPLVGAQCPLR